MAQRLAQHPRSVNTTRYYHRTVSCRAQAYRGRKVGEWAAALCYQDSHVLLPEVLCVQENLKYSTDFSFLNHEIFLTSYKVEKRIQQTPEVPITQLKK